jgi:integrase
MRNPNGYGSVIKLSGNRRKPYMIRITTGWELNEKEEKVRQLFRPIGYYKTRPEAILALAEYNKDPSAMDASTITYLELYEKWSKEKYDLNKISKQMINSYSAAYKRTENLYKLKFADLRKTHLQGAIDACNTGFSTKKNIKILFNQLYKFALENDIVQKDYSVFCSAGKYEQSDIHEPFTQDEMDKLFENEHRLEHIDTVLIMIYTGMRIEELLSAKTSNVNLDQRTMRAGVKTEYSKNRIIPLNKKILHFIEKRLQAGHEYLVTSDKGRKMGYSVYRRGHFDKIMEQLGMNHLPHDCRHTFATLADNAGMNKVSIKRIIGHASKDITDRIYTHKDIEELIKAIDLL